MSMRVAMKRIAAVLLALACAGAQSQENGPAVEERVYVQVGRLLADPAKGQVLTNRTVVVAGGNIVEVLDGFQGSGKVVDLRNEFVLPGLIDSHVHLTFENGPNAQLDAVKKTAADNVVDGVEYARRTLRAGFTTVVDLGADPDAIYALRDGIEAGKVQGPRIIAAGGVGAHGGHGDIHGYHPDIIKLF